MLHFISNGLNGVNINSLSYIVAVINFCVVQSNLYQTSTFGTNQEWSSGTGGHLLKHLYKTTTPNLVILGRFLVFIPIASVSKTTKICWKKICNFWSLKLFLLLLVLNITILRSGAMQVELINKCKSCEISNQMFFNIMFSFLKRKDKLEHFMKINKGYQLLTIFAKKLHHWCFNWV